MKLLKKCLLNLLPLAIAAIVTYIIGAAVSSVFVLKALPVKIPFGTYLSTAWSDVLHLQLYFIIILMGFLVAFPIAAMLRKLLPKIAKFGYPIAGAVAIGTALGLMHMQFETIPISGANSPLGFIAQLITGTFGGALFGKLQMPFNSKASH